jgi:putative endonuclease
MPNERRTYCVYIMGSLSGTLYIGMTGNLHKRVFEHKFHRIEGFTDKYQVERLLYWESFDDVHKAINREKQLKGWRRSKKIALIESMNPHWLDLAREWFPWMTSSGKSIESSSMPGKNMPGAKATSVEPLAKCHPERSDSVREANGIAESKDP